jgi:hypothetical protein
MKPEEIYETWMRSKKQIKVSRDFSQRVMTLVGQYEQRRKHALACIVTSGERISAHPLAKAAVIAVGTGLGLVRIIVTLQVILFA